MKALTIDALWAWAIIHGPKRVENRSWRTSYRGPLAIHAGRDRSRDAEAFEFLTQQGLEIPTGDDLERLRGRVLGTCVLVDCVLREDLKQCLFYSVEAGSPFAFGPWCWVLDGVEPLAEPTLAVGRQGLWDWDGERPSVSNVNTTALSMQQHHGPVWP